MSAAARLQQLAARGLAAVPSPADREAAAAARAEAEAAERLERRAAVVLTRPSVRCGKCTVQANDIVAFADWPYVADVERCMWCGAVTSYRWVVARAWMTSLGPVVVSERRRLVA